MKLATVTLRAPPSALTLTGDVSARPTGPETDVSSTVPSAITTGSVSRRAWTAAVTVRRTSGTVTPCEAVSARRGLTAA